MKVKQQNDKDRDTAEPLLILALDHRGTVRTVPRILGLFEKNIFSGFYGKDKRRTSEVKLTHGK